MIKWMISSSCLILFVIFLRHLFKGKISLRLQYALWALVAVRLLVPLNWGNSVLSIENLTNHLYGQSEPQTTIVQNEPIEFNRDEYTVKIYDGIEENKNVTLNVNEVKTPEVVQNSSSKHFDITQILLGMWIAGIVILAVVFLSTNIYFEKRVRRLRDKIDVPYTKLPVYKSDAVQTPCLAGIFHPSIYVTRHVAENDDILRHAVLHEMTHYKQGDLYWAVVRCACLTIHWYNPLVWWAAKLSKQDAELACDEATIKKLGEEERLAYGKTLIELTCEKRQDLFVTATTMASEKKSITERIRLIAKKPRFTMYALLLVVLAAIIAVIGTFTSAANKESEELPVSVEKCILNVNDALYYGTDETGPMGDSGCVAGNIRSTVDSGEVPLNNEESNFGCIGNPYTYDEGDGSIMVLMQDEEWHWFHISEYYNARPGNPCKNPEIAGWDLNNVKDVRADFNYMFPTPEEGTENYTYLLGQTERYYQLYGKGDYQTMLLEMDGKYAEINYPYASNYMELPELMEADVDQDGQTELFIILWLQQGTGLHIENLLLADFDDNGQLYVYQFLDEDYTAQLAENLSYEKTEDGIQPLVNGKPAGMFAKHLEDMEPFEAASVGNQMRFYYDKMTQEVKLSGQIMLLIEERPGGLWGNYNDVTATVQWNGERFYLTDFTSKNRWLDEQVEFALQDVYGVENLYCVKVNYDSTKMNQDTLIITAEILPEWTDSVFDHAEIHLRRSESPSSTSGWEIENIIMDAVSNAEKIIDMADSRLREGYEDVELTYVDNAAVGWEYYFDEPWNSEEERDALAQAALKELYTLTGYNVTECTYTTDGRSRFIFGKDADYIRRSIAFYSRDFGFTLCGDSTPYIGYMSARRFHYSDVQQLDSPYNKEEFSGHAAIPTWFLEHSGVYQGEKIIGYDAINLDDTVYTHIKLLFDGGYYIVVMDEEIESVSEVMGPYYNQESLDETESYEEASIQPDSYELNIQDEVYKNIIAEILETGTIPQTSGTLNGMPYKNYYTVMDIDDDGHEELILNFANTETIAGMSYYIYDYDRTTGEIYIQLSGYPSFTVYDNGYIKGKASHNHGRSNLDDFWPYLLYLYNPEADCYEIIAFVDAWQEQRSEDTDPDPQFPKDKDLDGDGIVYYDMSEDFYNPIWILDNEEYDHWCKRYREGKEIEIQWSLIITEEEYKQRYP